MLHFVEAGSYRESQQVEMTSQGFSSDEEAPKGRDSLYCPTVWAVEFTHGFGSAKAT